MGPLDRLRDLELFRAARTVSAGCLVKLGGLRAAFIASFILLAWSTMNAFAVFVPWLELVVKVSLMLLVAAIPIAVAGLGTGQKVFVELLSDDDLFLFDRAIEDVIVSPTVASFLVSQVALRPQLVGVFHELTKPWGAQIVLHPASEWLRGDATPIRFEDLEHLAAERGQIALGVQIANGELQLNPGREVEWALGPADRIVTLATFEEPA